MKSLNKKNINLIQSIVLLILLLLYLFGNNFYLFDSQEYCSFVSLIANATPTHYVFIALVVANLFMCLTSVLAKNTENKKDDKSHTIIAIVILLLFFVNLIMGGISVETGSYRGEPLLEFYYLRTGTPLLLLTGINIALSMFKRSKLVVEDNNNASNNPNETIDDLKKYKELLDQGIITQEEFDTKKKELLK